MALSQSFEDSIKTWVRLDNQHKQLNDELKALREQKSAVMNNINYFVETQQLSNATVNISDGQLRFVKSNSTQGLTLRFVEQCLLEIIGCPQKTHTIMNYIKSKRETKTTPDIRRVYNK